MRNYAQPPKACHLSIHNCSPANQTRQRGKWNFPAPSARFVHFRCNLTAEPRTWIYRIHITRQGNFGTEAALLVTAGGEQRKKSAQSYRRPVRGPWSRFFFFFFFNQSRCASVTDDRAGRSAQSDCQRETGESCPARALWSRTPSYDGKTRKCFFIIRAHGKQPAGGRIPSVGVLLELWNDAGFEENASLKKKSHKLMWCNSLFWFEHENYFNILQCDIN